MDDWLRELVLNRSQGVCEYCRIPQRFFSELFHIEHIVARQHRGATHRQKSDRWHANSRDQALLAFGPA